ncbi:MAG: biotin/lipoyl-containing protein, partial [Candidatus Spyradocola sp.]
MAVIQMPSRGKKDETGMITSWYKKTGDWVAQGDELFSFDTDEGTYTVKSQKAGRLVAIFVPEGELVHCPADVGMLASPAPEAVLKMGRMQFVDESKPLSPREAPQEAAVPEDLAAETLPEPEAETGAEEADAPDLPELPVAEEELLQAIPDDTEEIPPVEEPSAEEEEAALEPLAAEEEAPAAAEEENPAPEGAEEEAPDLALEPIEEEAPAEAEEPAAEEAPEAEAEPAEEEPEPIPEELEAVPQAEEEAARAEETAETVEAHPAPRPACLTAQVDMTVCREIAARTGVEVSAMVRFAAMHTDSAALLDEVEDGTLRGMSGRAL